MKMDRSKAIPTRKRMTSLPRLKSYQTSSAKSGGRGRCRNLEGDVHVAVRRREDDDDAEPRVHVRGELEEGGGDDDEDGHDGRVRKVLDDGVGVLVHKGDRDPVEGLEDDERDRERRVPFQEALGLGVPAAAGRRRRVEARRAAAADEREGAERTSCRSRTARTEPRR